MTESTHTRPPLLEARRATRRYPSKTGAVAALRGVDLAVRRGDFAVVLGPSGSGKSTLLNVLSGLDTVDEGRICYRGRELRSYTDAQRTRLRRRALAVVLQSFELVPLMSCYRNIEYPLLLARIPRRERGAAYSGLPTAWRSGICLRGGSTPCPRGSGSGSPSPAPWWESRKWCWTTR